MIYWENVRIEDEIHNPLSKWSKEMIVRAIGGQYKGLWSKMTKDDLVNIAMMVDGVQLGGMRSLEKYGHCKLYCINRKAVEEIEEYWSVQE